MTMTNLKTESGNMDSYELEKYTLEVVACSGCGKPLTIAVPYKGEYLCSDCKYNQSVLSRVSYVEKN